MKHHSSRAVARKAAAVPRLRRTLLSLALGCLAAGAAHAATLGEIFELARKSDAQYAAAQAAAEAGREKREQARAGLLPTVNLSGNMRQNHDVYATASTATTRNYGSGVVGLTIVQPLIRKVNLETYEQGELQALLADQQLKFAEQDLILRVSKGYFDVLQAQDALASVSAQRDAFTQQLAQAKRSFEVGLAPVTDVNEAQARYDLTLAQEIAAKNDLELKRRVLEKAIGADLPPLARLDEAASIEVLPPAQVSTLLDRAPEDSLQVAIGKTAEEIARREVSRQDAAQVPTVDLIASHTYSRNGSYQTLGSQTTHNTFIGVDVQFPVYQGGAISSRVREASANLERSRQELLNARRQATLDARQASLGVQSGLALHQALRQALSSSETQVRSTRRGFEVGVRTRVDVLNAEQQLFATRRDLAGSRYQTLVAGLQLKAAAGTLTDADLRAMDTLLK